RIFACACGERTTTSQAWLGNSRSSLKRPLPARSRSSSRRFWERAAPNRADAGSNCTCSGTEVIQGRRMKVCRKVQVYVSPKESAGRRRRSGAAFAELGFKLLYGFVFRSRPPIERARRYLCDLRR